MIKFNSIISEDILENPEELFKTVELALREFNIPKERNIPRIVLENIPKSHNVRLWDLHGRALHKLIVLEGIVERKTNVSTRIVASKYECPSCGKVINILQKEELKEPKKCACGRRSNYRLISHKSEESFELFIGDVDDDGNPYTIKVSLNDIFCDEKFKEVIKKGNRLEIVGILEPIFEKNMGGGFNT